MPELLEIIGPPGRVKARITLPLSKSMCNRAIMLMAATRAAIKPDAVSDADDSQILFKAVSNPADQINVGAGGTTLRFLLPYLAALPGYTGIVKGSARLMQRPHKSLLDALSALGADIQSIDSGFKIKGKELEGGSISLGNSESSQFASALLLAAPMMKKGICLQLPPNMPSPPYLRMTVDMMQKAGFEIQMQDNQVEVKPGMGFPGMIHIERDWSAASYWYGIAALKPQSEILLCDLSLNSVQGDANCADIFGLIGVDTKQVDDGLLLTSKPATEFPLHFDVSNTPDLFQTLCFTLSGLRKKFSMSGLSTLRVKETDRIAAVQSQLLKVNVNSVFLNSDTLLFDARHIRTEATTIFESFDDHRMAMSAAVLSSVLWKAAIRDPFVVSKSYPFFWNDLSKAGFSVRELES
jgi:3-phosphoshikimate 1-carboxyvinyltransferase